MDTSSHKTILGAACQALAEIPNIPIDEPQNSAKSGIQASCPLARPLSKSSTRTSKLYLPADLRREESDKDNFEEIWNNEASLPTISRRQPCKTPAPVLPSSVVKSSECVFTLHYITFF